MRWIMMMATFGLMACDGEEEEVPMTPFEEQAARGATAYGDNCAGCHGAGGEGTDLAPALVGLDSGALPLDPPPGAQFRDTQFVTVGDVAAFAVANMPPTDPGSLPETTYWDILAFDLQANGIDLEEELDAVVADTLTIPR